MGGCQQWSCTHAGGYQTFDVYRAADQTGKDESLASYTGAVGVDAIFQAFRLAGIVHAGQNEGSLIATYKANDMFTFETGYGYIRTKYDSPGATKDDAESYYLQSVITLAPGVSVTPEIGKIDYRQAGQEQITYVAAKWQIDF